MKKQLPTWLVVLVLAVVLAGIGAFAWNKTNVKYVQGKGASGGPPAGFKMPAEAKGGFGKAPAPAKKAAGKMTERKTESEKSK